MLFSDFIEEAEYIEKEKAEEQKQKMIAAAFTAWQTGTGGSIGFNAYLQRYGLAPETAQMTDGQREAIKNRALATAERIRKADLKK
jgi:hypothetical protein